MARPMEGLQASPEQRPFSIGFFLKKLEAGKARVVGYTSWPNLTYTVP